MIRLNSMLRVATLVLSGTLVAQNALASKPVMPQVSGHITALASTEVIVVDGHRYLVAVTSSAYKTMSGLHIGDAVSLIFDGPASRSASHVIAIQTAH